MSALPRVVFTFCVALMLAACQQQAVREGDARSTGELGAPNDSRSPANVYIELAAAYLKEKRLDEAYKNAQKAVIVDPSSSNARYVLAVVQQSLGQDAAADESYRKSVQLDPRNPNALNAYGSFLCGKGQYDTADQQFRQALNNPLYATPWLSWHNAGACLERSGDKVAAEKDFRSALRLNPRFPASLLGMARISFATENYLSARAYLQRYAEVAEHTAESLWLGVRTENQLGDRDQRAMYSLKLRAKFPDSDEAKYLQSIE
ncbi:MAG: type IV pilus biogenesis/stability protein PilW [Gammaproteobacteria bacterium]|nr:type IV pilus biogenesis/stability protein PilW [Gammaproteobacteria bacterium]MCB1924199.1 type IV pilus biogenesis/stability protein PilW [Gammaproteobacteria bacterium]